MVQFLLRMTSYLRLQESMRNNRSAKSLQRPKPKRDPYASLLIVCEGEKTEPSYLTEIVNKHRLNSANIKIIGKECGAAPCSIVEFAKKHGKTGDYDQVYCVFDRDMHVSFAKAVQQVKDLNASPRYPQFTAITSIPCFEIWLLLHFKYTEKSFYGSRISSTPCQEVIRLLKSHIPNYEKKSDNIYEMTFNQVSTATANAEKLRIFVKDTGSEDPVTNMDLLVNKLRTLKESHT